MWNLMDKHIVLLDFIISINPVSSYLLLFLIIYVDTDS